MYATTVYINSKIKKLNLKNNKNILQVNLKQIEESMFKILINMKNLLEKFDSIKQFLENDK